MEQDRSLPQDLTALMVEYQGGKLEAFEDLYAALAGRIERYLVGLSGDASLAKELVQETFLQVHRARHTFDPAYAIEPWLYAIARHVYLMNRRTRSRWRRLEVVPLDGCNEPRTPDPEPGASAKQELTLALAALTPQRREAWLLRYMWGLDFHEIAVRLGIRSDAAKLRAARGMATLRARLKGGKRR